MVHLLHRLYGVDAPDRAMKVGGATLYDCWLREQNVFSHWCTAERHSRESVRRTSRNPAHLQSFCRWASAELWTSSLQFNVYTLHCIAISITFICFTIYGFYIFYNSRNYLTIIIIVKMQWFGWGRRKRIRRWTPTAQCCRRTWWTGRSLVH